MLRLLLDEHISREVGVQAKEWRPAIDIQSIHDWESGVFLGAQDPEILMEAGKQGLTLVTYDQRTLWKHASDHLIAGHELGGIIFVDDRTIPPNDLGGLMRVLVWLWETHGEETWLNRLIFLTPAPKKPTPEPKMGPSRRRRRPTR